MFVFDLARPKIKYFEMGNVHFVEGGVSNMDVAPILAQVRSGMTWKNYQNETFLTSGSFHGVAIKRNLIMAAGSVYDRAVMLVGRRIN